ncbi:unnamed protein product [Caenorhabditis bovis]|uniref:Sigma non-opioid intracellular receptor 1 n=1 Tax=Caenorhabditis bovis TaxID=2654633 RepID=A0A8S1EVQ6_9PELO|nr:unnamed protein product [Caenorhabditis bovis]
MGFLFTRLTRYILVAYILYAAANWVLRTKSYEISPKQFKTFAAQAAEPNGDPRAAVNKLVSSLAKTYPVTILRNAEWHPVQLGNHDVQLYPLYLTFTEFAVVIASPAGSTGRIGFQWSNTSCTVLTGSVTRFRDAAVLENSETTKPKGNFRHGQFESFVYSLEPTTTIACYGRGIVPVSGLWITTSSIARGEPISLAKLSSTYIQSIYHQWSMYLFQIFNHYKARATGKPEL